MFLEVIVGGTDTSDEIGHGCFTVSRVTTVSMGVLMCVSFLMYRSMESVPSFILAVTSRKWMYVCDIVMLIVE